MAIITKLPNHQHETGIEHVKNLLDTTYNFSIFNSTANDAVFSYLSNLSDFLKQQEQMFYDVLNVQNIRGLNNLLQKINNNNNLSILDAGGTVFQEIKNRFIFKDSSKSEETKAQKQESDIFVLLTQLISNLDANKFIEPFIDGWASESEYIYNGAMAALTSAFENIKIGDGSLTFQFSAYGSSKNSATGFYSKKELGEATLKILNLNEAISKRTKGKVAGKITIQDNRFQITGNSALLKESVRNEVKNTIRPALEDYLNIEYQGKRLLEEMSYDQIRNEVINIIEEKGIILDSDDKQACKKIAIGAGSGNISGFLGELQSRLYFKQLFAGIKDAEIIDTGASYIKSLGGARQMDPADTQIAVLNHIFNIQVKNYAKGGAEWGGSTSKTIKSLGDEKTIRDVSSADSFVLNRLQIKDNNLLDFFGAATWHNLNSAYENDPKYMEYSNLYLEFQSIFNSLKESFDTFLPNIIRLAAFVNGLEDLQYENFYFQKGFMIPASAIIDGIIDALYNSPSNKIFTSSYAMYPGESHFTYQHPFENNYSSYAKETSISWKVTINFSTILRNLGL